MPLLAVTSRLEHTASLIRQTCSLNTRPPGPFTHTLLGDVPITEIIRDADESERKLIRLEGEGVERREVGVAAGASKRKATKAKELVEESVEVFAGAALELVEEYESMPRAKQHIVTLLERSSELHESIMSLQGKLVAARPPSPEKSSVPSQSSLSQLEDGVRELESNIALVKRKRDELRAKLRAKKHASASPSVSPEAPTGFTPDQQLPTAGEGDNPFLSRTGLGRSTGPMTSGGAWNADESLILNTGPPDSPGLPNGSSVKRGILGLEEEEEWVERSLLADDEEDEDGQPQEVQDGGEDDEPEADEPTVIMQAPPKIVQAPPRPSPARPPRRSQPEVAVTPAMEIAAARIWATPAAEALDPAAVQGNTRSAKETITFLQDLVKPAPEPASPAPASSISSLAPTPSHPTPDTIVLAKLLLTLLMAPSLAVPFNALKDGLRQFGSERGFDDPGAHALRVIYGYGVGRRVIRIDRARGVIVFDYSS